MEKILLATDFKQHSQNAQKKALEIANERSATLHIIYVCDHQVPSPGPYYQEDWEDKFVANNKEKAQGMCEKVKAGGEVHFVKGQVKEEIVKFVKENKISLLVMGSKWKKEKPQDSISSYVAANADCQTLLVQ